VFLFFWRGHIRWAGGEGVCAPELGCKIRGKKLVCIVGWSSLKGPGEEECNEDNDSALLLKSAIRRGHVEKGPTGCQVRRGESHTSDYS